MFVSDLKAPVWRASSEYCLKIDIRGLKIYPDFPSLLDYSAHFDENVDCFIWYSGKGLRGLTNTTIHNLVKALILKKAVKLIDGDLYMKATNFTGEMSRELLGTFVIDGDLLTKDRIVAKRKAKDIDKHDQLRKMLASMHSGFSRPSVRKQLLSKMPSAIRCNEALAKIDMLEEELADSLSLENFSKVKTINLCKQMKSAVDYIASSIARDPSLQLKCHFAYFACRSYSSGLEELADKLAHF